MFHFVTYRTDTGEIFSSGMASFLEDVLAQVPPDGCATLSVEAATPASGFFVSLDGDQPTVAPRPVVVGEDAVILADGEDSTILEVPVGSKVIIDGVLHGEIDDGVFEFSAEEPGAYSIQIEPPFPWAGATFEVTAQ